MSGQLIQGNMLSGVEAMDVLSRKLDKKLETYFPGIIRSKAVINGTPIGGQFAKTFRFDIVSGDNKISAFAKICPVFESLDPARMEYETLKLLYKKMPEVDPSLAVSRPIDYFPDMNAYIMESVGTNNFREYLLKTNSLFSNKNSISCLLENLKGCARWLKIFHQVTQESQEKFDSSGFLQSIIDEYDFRKMKQFGFKKTTMDRLDRIISDISSSIYARALPCAKWHWDYTPGHVFLDQGKFSVIDILGIDNTPIYEDIGRFMAALTSINSLPLHPFFNYGTARELLCHEFINAYFEGSSMNIEEGRFYSNIYRLKHLIFYFNGQHALISQRIHPFVGDVYMKIRGVKLFEQPILSTIDRIERGL